jgi:hypothetical protein
MDLVKVNQRLVTISKTDEEERVIKGVVYKPNELDSQEDWMEPQEIKKAAYDFMKNLRLTNVDTKHDLNTVDAFVCESYIAKAEDPDGYVEGAWVVAMKIEDEILWQDILKGEYESFSMWGQAVAYKDEAPPQIEGGDEVEEIN